MHINRKRKNYGEEEIRKVIFEYQLEKFNTQEAPKIPDFSNSSYSNLFPGQKVVLQMKMQNIFKVPHVIFHQILISDYQLAVLVKIKQQMETKSPNTFEIYLMLQILLYFLFSTGQKFYSLISIYTVYIVVLL